MPYAQAAAALRASGNRAGGDVPPLAAGQPCPLSHALADAPCGFPSAAAGAVEAADRAAATGLLWGAHGGRVRGEGGGATFWHGPHQVRDQGPGGGGSGRGSTTPTHYCSGGRVPHWIWIGLRELSGHQGGDPQGFRGRGGQCEGRILYAPHCHRARTPQVRRHPGGRRRGVAGENSSPCGLPTPPQDLGGPRTDAGTPYVSRGGQNGPGTTPPTSRGTSRGGWGQWCRRTNGWGGWGGRRGPRCGLAREGRPAVGYSLTPLVTWAREGRPAVVGYSLTPPVTRAREGRRAVGYSLTPPPPMIWAREGRPAVGYSVTPLVTWAREGRPAAVGYSLTPSVTWARGGRPAVGYSLAPRVTWAGRGRSLLTCGDIEADPGPGGWRLDALFAWLLLWALSPLSPRPLAPLPATVCRIQGALSMCAAPARTGANRPCIAGWGTRGPSLSVLQSLPEGRTLSFSRAFAGRARWCQGCISVHFIFAASKAPHCSLHHAEHLNFSQFQSRGRKSRRWLQVWVLLFPFPPPPPTPRCRLGKGGAWGSAATFTPTLSRHCCGWGW